MKHSEPKKKSPFSFLNIRLFIAFRIFFNARLYYPVFTVLFLDYGLSIEQFAILNTVWAITIVIAEVPSGALADVIGRKKLLLLTSSLMIFEMLLLAFVPLGNATLIFSVFLLNRVLSGLAEAMASGADEAIAYDTLVERGDPKDWPRVLSVQMRLRSTATILSVTLGALIFDSVAVNKILAFLGSDMVLTQQTTMRFPIYMTLVLGFFALTTAMMMKETGNQQETANYSIKEALVKTFQAGRWILATPFALAIILITMTYDHTLRMIVTMTSQYYRGIGLPDASFGVLGAGMAVLGLITPKIAEYMATHYSTTKNITITGLIGLLGLFGLTTFTTITGIAAMTCVFTGLTLTSFFTSHYLNRITASKMRATVLSFKGLAFNLTYGVIGVLFAVLMASLRSDTALKWPEYSAIQVENVAFQSAINWFPWYLLILMALLIIYCRRKLLQEPDAINIEN